MKHLIKAYSIDDIVYQWEEETDNEKLRMVLLNAFYEGTLKITDPVIDMACLDSDQDIEEFLQHNKEYEVCYLPSGHEIVFRRTYMQAICAYVDYGSTSIDNSGTLHRALKSLCVKKQDFLDWLKRTDQALPDFWFSSLDRHLNPTSKARKRREESKIHDPEFQEELIKKLEAIEAIRGVPVLLHNWFKHDTWKRKDGLMLLSGLSPETIFESEESVYGEPLRRIIFLETLDGLEGNPTKASGHESKLEFYERLWDSGDHPDRATPKYFIDWALSKEMKPSWLQWAVDNGYYCHGATKINDENENSGRSGDAISPLSEKSFLHIIGALCDLYWKEKYPNEPKLVQARIIDALIPAYEDFYGISERNLKTHLPKAIKAIRNE